MTEGWLIGPTEDPSNRFLLKYVSLEAHTVCNQSYSPVSIAPREHHFMPTEMYERIVGELSAYRSTIEAVFMINYNEHRGPAVRRSCAPSGGRDCRPVCSPTAPASRRAGSTLSWKPVACASCRSTCRRWIARSTPRTAARISCSWCSRISTTPRTRRWPSSGHGGARHRRRAPQSKLPRSASASPARGSTSSTTK